MTAPRAARITAALAVLALPVAAVTALLAAPASGADLGSLTFAPATGDLNSAPTVTTDGPCPPATVAVAVRLTGGNVPPGEINAVGNNTSEIRKPTISLGFDFTLNDIANLNDPRFDFRPAPGQPPLTYTATLGCYDNQAVFGAPLDTYDGQFTIASDGTYTAINPAPTPPPTSQPPTSQPPTSQPPTSEPPTSQPPTSEPPTSQPPTSQPPTSQPPTSQPPTSQPPTSQPPTSQPPTTAPETGTSDNVTVLAGGSVSTDREPTLARGDVRTLEVDGFEPGEEVDVLLVPEPVFDAEGNPTSITVNPLTTLTADDDGEVSYVFTVPAGAAPGDYAVVLLGAESDTAGVFVFDVAVPSATATSTTGTVTSGPTTAATTTVALSGSGPTGSLARTGASVGAGLALAGVLIVGGAGAVLATRRRGARQI